MENVEAMLDRHPVLRRLRDDLRRDLGDRLTGMVLYGSAARGDYRQKTSDCNVLLVLEDLAPATLERLSAPVRRFERQGQPVPRIFSAALIADAADVFPIEFLDILAHRVVVHGADPFAAVEVRPEHLRLQCERELREKLMRLREAYVEIHDRPRDLTRLLTDSYTTFAALFRGCLHLLGEDVPVHNDEVVSAFCARAGLDAVPFREVDGLKRGASIARDPRELFAAYYEQLGRAVAKLDRLETGRGEGR